MSESFARNGVATADLAVLDRVASESAAAAGFDLRPLFEAIVKHCPPPRWGGLHVKPLEGRGTWPWP